MKKLLVLTMVLAMAGMANAALLLSVDGVVDPPDTQINILPSDTVEIDIYSDGTTPAQATFLEISGPGVLDISGANNYVNPGFIFDWVDPPLPGSVWIDLSILQVPVPNLDVGTMADGIIMHCEDFGDVTLTLWGDELGDFNLAMLDTQVIHQVPEPMTICLLGLGGLLLRRRK